MRRGRKETEVARRIKRGIKRRETDPASNQFPKCSPPSGTHRDSQSWVEKRRGREETDNLVEKKESPKEKRVVKPVISLPSNNGTEDWVLKGTKLITKTKKQRLKI